MTLSYVHQHLHTLRAEHRYVIASSSVAVASAQLVLNANSTPAPVAGSLATIGLHVEDENGTWKLVLKREAAQVVGGDYFLRIDGATTNAQISGADAHFNLHSGLDIETSRKTTAPGTSLADGSSVTLAASPGAATELLAFEQEGLHIS